MALLRGSPAASRAASDETAAEMLSRTFVMPLHTGVTAVDRCARPRRALAHAAPAQPPVQRTHRGASAAAQQLYCVRLRLR
jgi:hypothetical protein